MADGQAGPDDTPADEGNAPADKGTVPASGQKHYTAVDAEVATTTSNNQAAVAKATSDNQAAVEMRRAKMGLYAVLASDVAIAVAAIVGVVIIHNDSASSTAVVSILSSAFTAVGTLTTAYFGIKATANTAKNSMASSSQPDGSANGN